jgi:hypothetical protein
MRDGAPGCVTVRQLWRWWLSRWQINAAADYLVGACVAFGL